MIRMITLLLVLTQLCACSSIKTVTKSNEDIGFDLYRNKSKCDFSTRIYSGVSYNFCRLNAKPKRYYNGVTGPWLLADMLLFAPIVDTVLLPVTITQQVLYGNPKVYKPRY